MSSITGNQPYFFANGLTAIDRLGIRTADGSIAPLFCPPSFFEQDPPLLSAGPTPLAGDIRKSVSVLFSSMVAELLGRVGAFME
mmetsp:Transcript_15276/g.31056  ORF Transcript_15276/g.31056 Transcript_15276/m.31056 type:complete len:84 (-) Transcript_15276:1064-1315(-)